MSQFVGIAKDHSGSMHSLTRPALADYNETLKALQAASANTDMPTIASVVKLGGSVILATKNWNIQDVQPETSYATSGGTPLFDAVNKLIGTLELADGASDPNSTFLIMAITDGEENTSHISAAAISEKMKKLQATDRWTFVFRVPKGYARKLTRLGIPAGNIQEWEQTESSLRESTTINAAAVANYYGNVSRGLTASKTFYTDMSKTSVDQVRTQMIDISKEVAVYVTTERLEIASFLTKMSGHIYVKGTGFYQLSKAEKAVQDYKLIVVRNKKHGAVYHGGTARMILGLPSSGTIKIIPGNHGDWDIYIQSTSTNRILPAGTSVLYWKNVR